MKKTVHIISHTHWDREWYLNSKFVNRWLPLFFEALFRMLEKEPEYRFVLDGQTSILDDCCEELLKKGKDAEAFRKRIKKYVQAGRLVIGPYYLQPDWQLISEEALVRNMLYGKLISQEFGGKTHTGWLLDNFGQIAQAPQIHKQFGMKGIVVWRGVAFEPEHMKSEFYWESPDGSRLPSVYLLSSYRNAMRLGYDAQSIYGRIRNEAEKIQDFAQTDHILLMNGYDQEIQPDDILPYIKNGKADTQDFTVRQSTPDEYMEAVIAGLKGEIPVFRGALYSGRYISVFPGILSCRMYLKIKNDELQRKIEKEAEPLCVMGALLGFPYPKDTLDEIWKLLLKNHPHDSICGVSVDDVHTDMEERFDQVESRVNRCIKETAGKLAGAVDTSAFGDAKEVYHVFHTGLSDRESMVFFPWEGKQEGTVSVRDEGGKEYPCQRSEGGLMAKVPLPAFGCGTFGIYDSEMSTEKRQEERKETAKLPEMENDYFHVKFHKNGSFRLTDKKHNRVYENMGYLEDTADAGDEYNYSYLKNDIPITTLEEEPVITVSEQGALMTIIKVEYLWQLPGALSKDRQKRSDEKEILPVTIFITMYRDSPVLRFKTVVRNRCKDHRIRVMFPTYMKTDRSSARTQFALTYHEIKPESFDNEGIPEKVKRIVIGARESEPVTQFPQGDFAAVSDGCLGAAVLNRGLCEYQVLSENTTIALTLFRSVGWLARVDLNTRIGDAGPEIFTPDAQCLRDMEFQYGFCLFEGAVEEGRLFEKAAAFNDSCTVAKTKPHAGFLPPHYSFLRLDGTGDICVTAVKWAQDKKGMIIRMFQAGEKAQQADIFFQDSLEKAYEARLSEEIQNELSVKEHSLRAVLLPEKIVTLKVLFKEKKREKEAPIEVCICQGKKERTVGKEYEIPLPVTEEEVQKEEARAERSKAEYEKAKEAYLHAGNKEISGTQSTQEEKHLAVLKAKKEAAYRAYLEAELSALFTWKKRKEVTLGRKSDAFAVLTESLDERIQSLADKLNQARIEKRVSEYLVDYYSHREEESNA